MIELFEQSDLFIKEMIDLERIGGLLGLSRLVISLFIG